MARKRPKSLKTILYKRFPSGDLPFFLSIVLLTSIILLATAYKSKALFCLGLIIAAAAFIYATIWMTIYNRYIVKKLNEMKKTFFEEDKEYKI